jgi:hypothetical protein
MAASNVYGRAEVNLHYSKFCQASMSEKYSAVRAAVGFATDDVNVELVIDTTSGALNVGARIQVQSSQVKTFRGTVSPTKLQRNGISYGWPTISVANAALFIYFGTN